MAKKVFIDPGHGGSDVGAVGVGGTREADINLIVSKKIVELLKKQGIETKMSRDTNKTLTLRQRTTAANNWRADVFVSIHCNAFNGSACGVESFGYKSSTSDLAKAIQDELLKSGAYTKNRGVKTAGFYVIKNTNMRAALIELAFIDNKDDHKILIQKQDELAEAIARGICKYVGVKYSDAPREEKEPKPVEDSETFYRVVSGSYNNRLAAEEKIEQLKIRGINSFIAVYKKED